MLLQCSYKRDSRGRLHTNTNTLMHTYTGEDVKREAEITVLQSEAKECCHQKLKGTKIGVPIELPEGA